jgi:anti-anti-sigma factor
VGQSVPGFEVEVATEDHRVRLVLRGELDLATETTLVDALDATRSNSREVAVDLRELDHIDSTGLRVLMLEAKRAAREERRFGVIVASSSIELLLERLGVDAAALPRLPAT